MKYSFCSFKIQSPCGNELSLKHLNLAKDAKHNYVGHFDEYKGS